MSRPQISYPTPIEQTHLAGPSREPMDPRRRTSNSGSSSSTVHPQGPRRVESHGSYKSGATGSSGGTRIVAADIESATISRHIESSVTRLLLATRQLLEGLNRWSRGTMREDAVSDIYVRLGDDFSQCVEAFQGVGISMSELASVPQELRIQLESCLSEEPSEEVMEQFNPQVRAIIIRLLSGLKEKQAIFRELQRRAQASPNPPAATPATGKTLAQQRSAAVPSRSNQPPPADAFRPPRMKVPESSSNGSMGRRSPSPGPGPEPPRKLSASSEVMRHTLTDSPPILRDHSPSPQPPPVVQISAAPLPPPQPPKKTATADMAFLRHSNRDSDGNPRPESRFSLDSEVTHSPVKSPQRQPTFEQPRGPDTVTPPAPTPPPLPILSLPELEPSPTESPEAIASLAALQRSDALERRASKRFSSYTFNKMLPGPSAGPSSPQRPMRRASRTVVPPLPSLPPTFGTGEIGFLVEEAEGEGETTLPLPERRRPVEVARTSPSAETDPPATPPRRTRLAPSPLGAPESLPSERQIDAPPVAVLTPPPPTPGPIPIFLQLGRQIKKAIVEPGLQLSSLRILFMEKFDYDPGMETFPDVYIRDPKVGVQYELEDMEDIKEGTMLSLNIEPLDQVKQHFDSTIGTLMQELKEMKSSMAQSRRLSMSPSQPFLAPVTLPPASLSRPSDERFDAVARQVAAVPPSAPGSPGVVAPAQTSNTVERTEQVSIDLRTQFDEVQNLRRDLGVMRQIYVDFVNQTKDTFQTLRTQTQSVREVAMTKLTGNRALVDADKAKLEARSQNAVQLVEDISDTIDACKEDVLKRSVMPRPGTLQTMKADLEKAQASVDLLLGQIATSSPIWKQTWNSELKTLLEEQHVLKHQEKLAADLKGDVSQAAEVYETLSQYVAQKQQVPGRGGLRSYRPPTPTEEGGVSHLMMEIRAKEMDPDRRLRAIEQQQKAREKEQASKTDEFTDELSGFVQGRKLKKTGGTEEAERLRQRRQELTLRKMMQSEGGGTASPSGSAGILSPMTTGNSVLTSISTSNGILTPITTGNSVLTPTPTGGSVISVASAISSSSSTPATSPTPAEEKHGSVGDRQ